MQNIFYCTKGRLSSLFSFSSSIRIGLLHQVCSFPDANIKNIIPPNVAMPEDMKKTFCHCSLVGCKGKGKIMYD